MWKALKTRYRNNLEALNIINDLESLFQNWNPLPSSFYIGDHNIELINLILSDMGYTVLHNEQTSNEQGTSSCLILVTEKKVTDEMWLKVSNRPHATDIIRTLKDLQKKYKFIPCSFYVGNNLDLALLKCILLEIGYMTVSTKYIENRVLIQTSKVGNLFSSSERPPLL